MPLSSEKWVFPFTVLKDISNAGLAVIQRRPAGSAIPDGLYLPDWWFGSFQLLPRYAVEPPEQPPEILA